MFLVLQLPFTDSRPFLPVHTNRLPNPVWSSPRTDKDFVRSFGSIKKRLRGGVEEWPSEGFYCLAERALNFDSSFTKPQRIADSQVLIRNYCAFRRFLSDGCAVARVEVGIKFRARRKPLRFSGDQCLQLMRSILNQQVAVPLDGGARRREYFLSAHGNLAKLYLRSSTKRPSEGPLPPSWWFAPGRPLMVLEHFIGVDTKELPRFIQNVQSEVLTDAQISLAHTNVEFRGQVVGVWLLGLSPYRTDPAVLRSLRLNLLRLHAEVEGIREIFRLIATNKITIEKGTSASDQLQLYLNKSIRLLSREARDGMPQSRILDVAYSNHMIESSERQLLLERLSEIRRNYFNNIEKFTRRKESHVAHPTYNITAATVVITKELSMAKQEQNIYGNVAGNVNQVAAQNIRESFNQIAQSGIAGELKARLEELGGAVEGMMPNLSEKDQKKVAKDYKALTEEVTSEEPRREWYELSAKGIIEAAKTVGEIATPVIAVVKSILTLLG